MIVPTIGRKVWYTPGHNPNDAAMTVNGGAPYLDATVVYVHNDRLVNLVVLDHVGMDFARLEVQLIQDGDERPETGRYAEWMPYQIGQAKK